MAHIVEKTVKNSVYSLLYRAVMIPFNFLLQVILLKYIGVELVGISATTTSVIGALSLAEGGVGSAIAYCLYRPVVEKNDVRINQIMAVLKKIYMFLCGIVVVFGIVISFFLKYILNGVELTSFVYIVFYLICLNSAISYLCCYRRTLLSASMQTYIINRVDIFCEIVFMSAGILCIYFTRNYILYLVISILKTITSNMIIHAKCKRLYPYLKSVKALQEDFKEVFEYSKNLFWGNLAGYVYGSVDNVVVSAVSNTVNVGYLTNYTLVTSSLEKLANSAMSGAIAAVGQIQVNADTNRKKAVFLRYAQICYLIGTIVCVPTYVLLDDFITNIYGEEYMMGKIVSILLVTILYIRIVPTPYGTFISTSGMFDKLKKVEMAGALGNLFLSLIFVSVWGIPGVLSGTVISTVIQWCMRSFYVFTGILNLEIKDLLKRFFHEAVCAGIVLLDIITTIWISGYIHISTFILRFIVLGIISEIVAGIWYGILYRFDDKFKITDLLAMLMKFCKRKHGGN